MALRELLQWLGPTFIKVGQFLALRPDLIAQEYCDELMGLLDQVLPFTWSEARHIIRQDLGSEPMRLFTFINPKPIAAGSLAQTHFARLRNGAAVAVKILRPDARVRIQKDIRRLRFIARLLEMLGISSALSPRGLIEELSVWLLQEIDLRQELANLEKMYQLTRNSTDIKVPKPYGNLSSERIITTAYLRGIPISEIIAALASGRQEERARVKDLEVDWDSVAENFLTSTLTQIFKYQFFHADVHPGNLLLLPGDKIGYVDFGLCATLHETIRLNQTRYLAAAFSGNIEQMFDALIDLLIPTSSSDMQSFYREFTAVTRAFLQNLSLDVQRRGLRARPVTRLPIAQWLIAVMRAAHRYKYRVPSSILSMYRALLTAETVANTLAPAIDLRSVGPKFFAALAFENTLRAGGLKNLQPAILEVLDQLHEYSRLFCNVAIEALSMVVPGAYCKGDS